MLANFHCLQQDGEYCRDQKLTLTPFVQPLPIPRDADDVVRVSELNPAVNPADNSTSPTLNRAIQGYDRFPPEKFYEMTVRPFQHLFHPELSQTSTVWGYSDMSPGPTFRSRYGHPILVRIHNDLPPLGDGTGFGIPQITTHLHNFHSAAESDGGPVFFYDSGHYTDHHYAMYPAGGDAREVLNHLWYHDHRPDFTSHNVYKGLAGHHLIFDELDSGNENDPNPAAFHMPSGEYDVPLGLGDKQFDPVTHLLKFDPFNLDGFLGDHITVNGAVTPYFEVARRKYRLRIVNFGPSRIYDLRLAVERPDGSLHEGNGPVQFHVVGNDGNLLERPIKMEQLTLSVAERFDVIVDFSKVPLGSRVQIVNVADQTSGKGRTGVMLRANDAMKVLQFRVVRDAADPSVIPHHMREKPVIPESEIACTRTFVFDNQSGGWTINNKLFDFTPRLKVKRGTAERWILRNASRDWEHPIHIHFEEHQFEVKDGTEPPPWEAMRKDVALLRPGDEITVALRHRDWLDEYPLHCHNTVHEDHAMMLLWKVVEEDVPCDPNP